MKTFNSSNFIRHRKISCDNRDFVWINEKTKIAINVKNIFDE